MKKIYPFLFLAVLFASSCTNRKELSITFVFDKPIEDVTKYPSYFKELTVPFASSCDCDYLIKPIKICRLDISNKEVETNAWWFKDIGENEIEFSKGYLEQYFKDSSIHPYLIEASKKEPSIESWITNIKDSVFVFSEEANVTEYKGKMVFNNTKQLYEKIQEVACTNPTGRIVVLVNPNIGDTQANLSVTQDPIQLSAEDASKDGTGKIIKEALLAITDIKKTPEEREKLANEFISNYMTNETKIDLVEGKTNFPVDIKSAKEYIITLANKDRVVMDMKIFDITYSAKADGKVLYMRIEETNK